MNFFLHSFSFAFSLRQISLCAGLLCILSTVSQFSSAQPIIDGASFTQSGTQLEYLNASPLWEAPANITDPGESLEWDISNFNAIDTLVENYFAVSSLNFLYQSAFNGQQNPATLSDHFSPFTDFDLLDEVDFELPVEPENPRRFWRNDETGYYEVGVAFELQSFPLITPFESVDRVWPFPLEYDVIDTSIFNFLISVPFVGAYGQDGFRYNHADAWGTLITPNGTYDALRVRTELLITDTVAIADLELATSFERPLQVNFTWFCPDMPGPLFRMSFVGGQMITAQLLDDPMPTSTTASSAPDGSMQLFPNPSQGASRLILPSSAPLGGSLHIYDVQGRKLVDRILAERESVIDLSALASGMYTLHYIGLDGQMMHFTRVLKR